MKKLLYTVIILLAIGGVYLATSSVQKMSVVSTTGNMTDVVSTSTSPRANTATSNISTSTKQVTLAPIGGSKDSHGCVLGGGYSWDDSMGACVRPWEKLSVLIPSKKWYLVNTDGTISDSVYFETDTNGTKVSGKACNSFSGAIKINDKASTVYISNVISTMMACADSNITKIESKFFNMASGTIHVSLNEDNSHVTLTVAPSIKMEFAPKDK